MNSDTQIWNVWSQQERDLFVRFVRGWLRGVVSVTADERAWLISRGWGEAPGIVPVKPTQAAKDLFALLNKDGLT